MDFLSSSFFFSLGQELHPREKRPSLTEFHRLKEKELALEDRTGLVLRFPISKR